MTKLLAGISGVLLLVSAAARAGDDAGTREAADGGARAPSAHAAGARAGPTPRKERAGGGAKRSASAKLDGGAAPAAGAGAAAAKAAPCEEVKPCPIE